MKIMITKLHRSKSKTTGFCFGFVLCTVKPKACDSTSLSIKPELTVPVEGNFIVVRHEEGVVAV